MTLPTAVLTIRELADRLQAAEHRIEQLADENSTLRRDLCRVVAGISFRN